MSERAEAVSPPSSMRDASPEDRPPMRTTDAPLEHVEKGGPAQREVVVTPQSDLKKGEGIILRFESGATLDLVKGIGGAFRGHLTRSRLEDPFSVHRTPGNVPEVGFHGQALPRRTAARIDEPLWVYPVAWADRLPRGTYPTRSGLHQDLVLRGSERVPEPRVLRVHLPEAYLREPERRFPVVYVLDGQNAFDASTSYGGVEWCLDDIALQLEEEGGPPCILVGVDNGCERRIHEYSFCPPPPPPPPPKPPAEEAKAKRKDKGKADRGESPSQETGSPAAAATRRKQEPPPELTEEGGGAKEHLDFLLYEVAPLIRSRFRAAAGERYLIGSSMGGLFGLWASISHPGAFRGIASLSPSVWWARQAVLRVPLGEGPRPRLWLDMGSRESKAMVEQYHAACGRLEELGWTRGDDLRALLIQGGTHHESSWADRSASVLRYLLSS